ncbi:sugar ABC transporter substrate-binding protein [Leptothoe kymatousa]|uniref:Sugar ABC transporter substrate-binding protein n=1 Tax=Leptothoe kymatousa TAU-MAC 1615 TaxID=2364775 RepID=A0ABS5Y3C2_9CYAN|nr:sugar ABC transporter substrate-binding protein [Leptothoe kymatousa]MBT9312013.1 sugar ABC transporter substrate-binding protein [Leptothoe kymatousa TAU-MAC 1615]
MVICLSGLLGSCPAEKIEVPQTSAPAAQQSSNIDLPPAATSADLETVVPATQPWKIIFVSQDGPKGHENISDQDCPEIVWCHMWQTAQETAQELGVDTELAYVGEDCSQEQECIRQQIQLLNELIMRDDIDGIVIGPRDSNQLVPVVEKAIAKNIAIMAVGTPINSAQVLTLVTFNDFEGGKAMGQWVAERLKGTGNVLIIEGPKYQKNALDRRHGFVAGLQGQNITILDTETALWSCQTAQTITEQWLTKFPKVDAIIAASDHMALGAAIATQTAQRPDILITGYDAIPVARAAIAHGTLAATAMQLTTTPTAIQLMVRHLENNETFPEVVYLPTPQLLSQANLSDHSVNSPLNISPSCRF